MAEPEDTDAEPVRKGRSNAILTYETVEAIKLAIQKVDLNVAHLATKMDDVGKQHIDHEVRIRALELTIAGSAGGTGFAKWVYSAMWPAAAFGIALLNYLK